MGRAFLSFHGLDKTCCKRWEGLSEECRRRLADQQIVPGNPGTILQDVDTLIQFVGPAGVPTQSGNSNLPSARLPELNAKMGHPITLQLKRPLLRDYPNIAGTFVLLRVMDLLKVEGSRLVICPKALEAWRSLNPTEQYFALLQALLFYAQSSVLAHDRRHREQDQSPFVIPFFLGQLTQTWRDFDLYQSVYDLGQKGRIANWSLFLQQQLGLIELRPRSAGDAERNFGGRGWLVGGARLTPWGTALTWALLELVRQGEGDDVEDEETDEAAADPFYPQLTFEEELAPLATAPEEPPPADPSTVKQSEEQAQESHESSAAPPALDTEFRILQPFFKSYFPEWRAAYIRPKPELLRGTHIFKVILAGWRGNGKVWRLLAVPPTSTLDRLAGAILDAFSFDDDHLYDFRYRDQRGISRIYNRPYSDDGPFTTDITVEETELPLKGAMHFTFDYGDNWEFEVVLEKIDPAFPKVRKPKIIGSAGKAPRQYPDADSDW